MIRHIILWKLRETLTAEEKEAICRNAKEALEGMVGKIEGLLTIKVEIQALPSSNADMMLYSELASENALAAYQKHPVHVAVADTYVRPFISQRLCLDCPCTITKE